jgi:hypothetical protein
MSPATSIVGQLGGPNESSTSSPTPNPDVTYQAGLM